MPDLINRPLPTTTGRSRLAAAARWMITFIGFPIGGLIADLLLGPVDDLTAALIGGLITGLSVGAPQAWGLALDRRAAVRWIAATAAGFMVGLGLGSAAVAYRTTLASLVIQGAICGLAVGAAQAGLLWTRLGRPALAWPVTLGAIWALGWAVTSFAGIQVGDQFTVFGSAGAVVVTALTGVLPLAFRRTESSAS